MLSDSEAARDAAQEIWLKLIDQRKKPPTVEHPTAYLFQIAKNQDQDIFHCRQNYNLFSTEDFNSLKTILFCALCE